MKKRYKIGDRVILTEGSAYSHQSKGNPGTIIDLLANYRKLDDDKLDYREFYFQIEWDNGNRNCYKLSDIKPFKKVDDQFILPDYWHVRCEYSDAYFPELYEWRGDSWVGQGYIDHNGIWSEFEPMYSVKLTYREFIEHVYEPWLKSKKSEEVNPEEPEEKNSLIQKVNQINYPVKRKTKRSLTI